MIARTQTSILALALSPLALGCTGSGTSPEDIAEIQSALELENGGLSTEPESPAFGDGAVKASPALVTTFTDTTDLTKSILEQPGAARYHVMVVWGHLPPARDAEADAVAPSPIDRTGQVSVAAGAIGVSRTLAFDPKDGVAPRTSPTIVAFTSRTLPAVDGLLLDVVIPEGGAKLLRFETAAMSADIDLALVAAKGGDLTALGDGRNGLAFYGFEDEPGLAQGFVMGRWGKLDAEVGRLRGRVFDEAGAELGHVKGFWGHAPKKDADLFFGKYIDETGAFRGLLGGGYGNGAFHGQWGVKGPAAVGTLEGRYSDGLDDGATRGFFIGRWSN